MNFLKWHPNSRDTPLHFSLFFFSTIVYLSGSSILSAGYIGNIIICEFAFSIKLFMPLL